MISDGIIAVLIAALVLVVLIECIMYAYGEGYKHGRMDTINVIREEIKNDKSTSY